jgi:protease-4
MIYLLGFIHLVSFGVLLTVTAFFMLAFATSLDSLSDALLALLFSSLGLLGVIGSAVSLRTVFRQLPNPTWFKRMTALAVFFVILGIGFIIYTHLTDTEDGSGLSTLTTGTLEDEPACTVQGILLRGTLTTYQTAYTDDAGNTEDTVASEDIVARVMAADADESIQAILLEVDSFGGVPAAAYEAAAAIHDASKPVIVQIRGAAASAAYWVAAAGDHLIATPVSDIGSIGVTMSYLDSTEHNQSQGYIFQELNSAPFKDYTNPDKPLTESDRALIQRDLDIIHSVFVTAVSEYRGIDEETMRTIADGSSVLGETALALGLIDEVGTDSAVREKLRSLIGAEPVICWQ